jgi:hypothetical protein
VRFGRRMRGEWAGLVLEDGGGGAAGEFWGVASGRSGEFDECEHGLGAGLGGEEIGAQVPEVGEGAEGALDVFVRDPLGQIGG